MGFELKWSSSVCSSCSGSVVLFRAQGKRLGCMFRADNLWCLFRVGFGRWLVCVELQWNSTVCVCCELNVELVRVVLAELVLWHVSRHFELQWNQSVCVSS